ncbi:FAD-dependent monooxygenase [Nonomuraea wenchangensis]
MTSSSALVVGGGIGGLATAIGLRRNGWQVTLLERAPSFRPLGSGITLAPNAVRALDALELGVQLRAKGMAQGAAGLRAPSGRWLMRAKVEALEHRMGVPAFALHRADLHDLLAGALEGGARRCSPPTRGPSTPVTSPGEASSPPIARRPGCRGPSPRAGGADAASA